MNNKNKQPKKWYKPGELFDKTYLKRQERSYEKIKKEVDFIEKVLSLKEGDKILDLACGSGRHAMELARRDYEITAQDLNPYFLKRAQEKASEEVLSINWVEGDMREIPFKEEFNAVININSSFGYFEREEENQRVLDQVQKSLKSKGLFFLEIHNREEFIRNPRLKEIVKLPNGGKMKIKRRFDFASGRLQEKRIIIREDEKKVFDISLRQYTLAELITMCKNAQLKYKESYGNYDGDDLSFDTQKCILIVEKS